MILLAFQVWPDRFSGRTKLWPAGDVPKDNRCSISCYHISVENDRKSKVFDHAVLAKRTRETVDGLWRTPMARYPPNYWVCEVCSDTPECSKKKITPGTFKGPAKNSVFILQDAKYFIRTQITAFGVRIALCCPNYSCPYKPTDNLGMDFFF